MTTTKYAALGLALFLSLGASCRGTISQDPTGDQTQDVRRNAIRAAEAVSATLTIVDETGKLIETLPLDAAAKNRYDCAILKATGTTQPASANVVKACGPVPLTADAPLPKALVTLKTVSTCPSLKATVTAAREYLDKLIVELETSTNATLRMSAIGLRATLAFLTDGGVMCSA